MSDLLYFLTGAGEQSPLSTGTVSPEENVFRWATVESVGPLVITLDGDSLPLDATPSNLAGALAADNRVWVQIYGRRVIVLGKATDPVTGNPL